MYTSLASKNKSHRLFPTLLGLVVFFQQATFASGSDSLYVRRITDTLASKEFLGRGYVNDGMQKAAQFIATEMKAIGLQVETQAFHYPVNTFPGEMALAINGQPLQAGKDFIVGPESRPLQANGNLVQTDSLTWVSQQDRLIIKLVDKLTWSVAQEQADYTSFQVLRQAVGTPASFACRVEAKFKKSFNCDNVIGTIKGSSQPDSFIVFTAHYDHLGTMGKNAWFAGANDNAGGVALMLGMAKRLKEKPLPYTFVFIAFAGEEAGLLGSKYYTGQPGMPLKNIRFLINLDLMGNGDEGITVVNATEFPQEFALLQRLNTEKNLLTAVNSRGKAANSDHYWFTEKGVPSFFIYTLGKRKAYHDIDDVASTVPWWEVNDLETLLTDFTTELTGGK